MYIRPRVPHAQHRRISHGLGAGAALAQVEGDIAVLRDSGRYATPQLLSIKATDVRMDGENAHVRTLEHWLYQERTRLSGALVVVHDQRVEDLCDLRRQSGGRFVVRNEVTRRPAAGALILGSPGRWPTSSGTEFSSHVCPRAICLRVRVGARC